MKIFHELVFDEFMEEPTGGAAAVQYRARLHWWPVIGNVESLRFYGFAERVSATVDLKWTLHHSPSLDTSHLSVLKAFPNATLTGAQTTTFRDSVPPTDPGMPASYAYILICSLVTTAKAHVRIWVTGRGERG